MKKTLIIITCAPTTTTVTITTAKQKTNKTTTKFEKATNCLSRIMQTKSSFRYKKIQEKFRLEFLKEI